MKVLASPKKIMLFFSAVLIAVPILMVRFNLLSRNFIYSGSVHDALGMGTVDLVKLTAGGETTYTDKDGKFSLLIKSPLLWGLPKSTKGLTIEALPTFNFEGSVIKVPCTLVAGSIISTQVDCSTLVYPTASTVAARVLATEISQGLFSAPEIAVRKSNLWDFLSEQSQEQWQSKDEFVSTLVSQETDRAKIKSQPVSFSVSKAIKMFSEYNYLGKISVKGETASVDASVTDAAGKVTNTSLYFVKKDSIWRYLMPDRRGGKLL